MMKNVLCVLLMGVFLLCAGCGTMGGNSFVSDTSSLFKSESVSAVPAFNENAEVLDNADGEYGFYIIDGALYNINRTNAKTSLVYRPDNGKTIFHLCFSEDRIFFVEKSLENLEGISDNDSFRICKVDKNGEKFSQILDDSFIEEGLRWDGQFVRDIAVYKNYLLIGMSFELYVHDLDCGSTRMISVAAREFQLIDEELYYLDSFSVFRHNLPPKKLLQS